MSVAMAARGCCSTARAVWTTNHRETRGWPGRCEPAASRQPGRSKGIGLCYQAEATESIFSLDTEPSPCAAGPLSITLLHCPPRLFSLPALAAGSCFPPSLSQSCPRDTSISLRAKEKLGFLGGFKGLGKNLPLGISFFHLRGINCAMAMEALQLGGELLRAKHVEAKTLLVPPHCRTGC